MLNFRVNRIFIANDLVDMRKSFDTLADYVQINFKKDPLSGDAFVFIGKRRNRLKVLWWDTNGFWLLAKRLEKGRFHYPFLTPVDSDAVVYEVSTAQWQMLLEGIIPLGVKKMERYHLKA